MAIHLGGELGVGSEIQEVSTAESPGTGISGPMDPIAFKLEKRRRNTSVASNGCGQALATVDGRNPFAPL